MFREILWPRVRRRTRQEAGAHILSKSDSTASVRSHERPPTAPKTIYSLNDLRDTCPVVTAATLSTSPVWMTSRPASARRTQPRAINGRSVRG